MKGDELDRILDGALASYTAREPRVGFSARIMAQVQAESPKPRWNWLSFATAAVALTSLAATVMMWRNEALAPVGAHVRTPVIERVPVMPAIVTTVKLAPRPDPLTHEQRALLTFAKLAPQAALQLAQPDKPLEIEALNIPPLQIDGIEIGELK